MLWGLKRRSSIPHLNSLSQQYSKHGVVVIGITNETDRSKLNKFIQSMKNNMSYRVAIDDSDVMSSYNDKYKVNGIPHAFIIDHLGKVRWSGHPMSPDFPSTLERLTKELQQYQQKQNQQNQIKNLTEADLNSKSVKELQELMKSAGISDKGCIEKSDLINRILGKSSL